MTTRTTREILASMLTENTGRHFLDSGGAYGRNWERTQGMTVEMFEAQEPATIDKWGCVTLDVFHYLAERLEYDQELDDAFHKWATTGEQENEPWLQSARRWAELQQDSADYRPHHVEDVQTYNSYNGEDFLSQVIQWVEYEDPAWGGRIILLQIHGGCDVRGGYTAPRAFRSTQHDFVLYDYADATVSCEGFNPDPQVIGQLTTDGPEVTEQPHEWHSWDLRGGIVEYFHTQRRNADGSWASDDESYGSDVPALDRLDTDDDGRPLCPVCKSVLRAEPPYAD